ncbi:MAG: U32 family peptidase [Bacteroidales bacterium]|jgi:putative protease|nr:U32 family peptidase [Bacteroidales bacterium]
MQKKIEIMSPVGSYESLAAAIQGGAGSVYFGVGSLNMRSRSSQNFSLDDLAEISRRCRENNVRSYLVLNTIIYDEELETMQRYIDAAKANHISAIIASDISVMEYARSQGVEVHISTQCNVTNIEAVRFYARYADVIVLARELTLKQTYAITQAIEQEEIKGPSGNLAQIELFVHGALCMAVSGKCYLSLDNFNSSGNRGACFQPCRRGYIVKDKENELELEIDHEYIMSPKDLKTIDFLDRILKAGVTVLKIEGRGRSPEYVKVVTECYHEAVEAYQTGIFTEEKIEQWNKKLSGVYNRGFWDGYYLGRKMGEWTDKYGSLALKKKVYIGKITNFFANLNVAEIKMEASRLRLGDEIRILGETTGVVEDVVDEIRVDLKPVEQCEKGIYCSIPSKILLRRGDKVYKVIDADFD